MNQQTIAAVCEEVYRRFPELTGRQPNVQNRPDNQFLLVFRGSSKAADGRTIAQTVRVVVSAAGKVVKITTSR